jgi:hypothetical protein
VQGSDDELQFVREQMVKLQLRLIFRLQRQGQVDAMLEESRDQFRGVAGFDTDDVFGKALLEFAEHGRNEMLASRGARAEAQSSAAPFPEMSQ